MRPAFSVQKGLIVKKLLGFQVADKNGRVIQGEEEDPTGYASFQILSPELAVQMVQTHGFMLLYPIFEGDMENYALIMSTQWLEDP